MTHAIFAIPGDKDQRTGGYIYDAAVLRHLNDQGCVTRHLELPDSFPNPTHQDVTTTFTLLNTIDAHTPVIIDGLALGALPPEHIATLAAPVIALVHHPLGLETGVPTDRAAALIENETQVLRHAAHIIVTSPHTADTLQTRFDVPPQKITTAIPGFDRPTGTPPTPVSPALILSIGLLSPRKGHDTLIQALAQITDLPWHAEIIGRRQDTAYSQTLTEMIKQLALTQRVKLVGEVDAPALQAAYQRASLFALATRYEGYGIVLSEAMLHGLPVVSCDVGAVPGTMGAAGHLVPPDDASAFATALRTLLEDDQARAQSGQKSRDQAATLPTWQQTAQIFSAVIAQVTQ